jgi:hypothetical protein
MGGTGGHAEGVARSTTQLRRLIDSPELDFLCEAHKGMSARNDEEAGFRGMWASGLTISASLGVRDNNEINWTQVLEVLEHMSDASTVPIGLVLVFFTGLFRNLPEAVLAAIVLIAVKGLIDLKELRYLWHDSGIDSGAAGVALAGVLDRGILDGVLVAVLASVVMLMWRVVRPHVAFLGRTPGTDRIPDVARHPENEAIPGVLAFRVEASLVYFNVDHVPQTALEQVRREAGLRRVVQDLSTTPYVDVAGARMLRRL